MLGAAEDAAAFLRDLDRSGFEASRLHQHAVIRCLEIVGEAAAKVSPEGRAARPDLPWREAIGMRHRLIHGHADVRLDVVWRVASQELPSLAARSRVLLGGEHGA